MSSDGEASWKELVAGLLAYAALGLVIHGLYQRFLAPVVWIRSGDPQTALRVVEIVAVLLPLLAIFFQILFRQADDENSPLQDRAEELLPSLLITFLGLFVAGMVSTVVVLFGGVGVGVGAGLVGLLVALSGLLIVVVTFATVVGDEYDIRTEQQQLGDSTPEKEPQRETEDHE